jgi:hypothetical protein
MRGRTLTLQHFYSILSSCSLTQRHMKSNLLSMISTPPFTNYFLRKGFQSRGRMATTCSLQQYGRPPPFINLHHKQQHSLSNCSSRISVMVGNRSVMLQGFGNNNSSKAATAGMVVKCSGIGIGGWFTVFVIACKYFSNCFFFFWKHIKINFFVRYFSILIY